MIADDEREVRTIDIEMAVEGRIQVAIVIIDRGTGVVVIVGLSGKYYFEFTRCDATFERTERGG